MYFDSFNPKRVPTLQFKAIWLLKGYPAPAFIHNPLPRPLTPISIVTLGMLDICLFRCISSLSTLNVFQHYNSKQYGYLNGARPRLHSKPPATPPYSYQHSDPGDAWYMPISMHFDPFNPIRVPTLQIKAIWVLKGCPAPASILSPLPRPLTPIRIVTLRMLDICLFRCILTLSTLNVCQHYKSKQYGC